MGTGAQGTEIDLNKMDKIGQNIQKISGSEKEEDLTGFLESSSAEESEGGDGEAAMDVVND